MSKLNKFQLFEAAMAMSGYSSIRHSEYGDCYASYLVMNKIEEVGSKFNVDHAVEIMFESEKYQQEYDQWLATNRKEQ